MNRSGKLHALLSTARVANVPSVVSNVWVGVAIGLLRWGQAESEIPWVTVGNVMLAGMLLYVGGNFLNDWKDHDWDRKHRPERALPRGLFPPGFYLALAVGLMISAGAMAFATELACGVAAMGIVLSILIYTFWHKRTAWAVIPMGMCRALLPVMGIMAFYPYVNDVWPFACALLYYVTGLSLSARYESMTEPPWWVGMIARGLLLATAVLVLWGNKGMYFELLPSVIGVLPYLAWTGFSLRFRRKPVPLLVSSLLAGIPLVDWMVLLPLSVMLWCHSSEVPDEFGIACFIIPPLAFLSALLLQRLAPAT